MNIDIIDIIFLPLVFFISIVTTYEDLKYGKIKNKWILLGISGGLIGYLILIFILTLFLNRVIITKYFLDVLINFIISIIVSYLLWKFKIWSAGDSKLYSTLAFLIPLHFYSAGYFKYFPSFSLLINIFMLSAVTLCLMSVIEVIKYLIINLKDLKSFNQNLKHYLNELKSNWKGYLNLFLVSIIMYFPLLIIKEKLKFILPISATFYGIVFIILIIVFKKLYEVLKNNKIVTTLMVSILVITCLYYIIFGDFTLSASLKLLKFGSTFMLIIVLIRKFIDFYINKIELSKIKVTQLEVKYILTEETIKKIKNLIDGLGSLYPEGLTTEQVKLIKEKVPPEEEIEIYKPTPFAHYIFGGVISILLLKQSFVHLFLYLRR